MSISCKFTQKTRSNKSYRVFSLINSIREKALLLSKVYNFYIQLSFF